MKISELKEGDRVICKKYEPCEDFPDGLPEERGEIVQFQSENNMVIVQLDEQFSDGDGDDLCREMGMEQIEKEITES